MRARWWVSPALVVGVAAHAALPTTLTQALEEAGAGAMTVAGFILFAIVSLVAAKFLLRVITG